MRDEVKKLRDAATGEMMAIDVAPMVGSGLLHVLELSGDLEQTIYVEQAAVVDDGEAMSIAIAGNRGLELAIDDKRAAKHALRTFPKMRLWTTPEILKRWADAAALSKARLKEALMKIETRSRYVPPKSHALASWWQTAR